MTGIELISQEREEQLSKHGRTIESDKKFNTQNQLLTAATMLVLSTKDEQDEMTDEDILEVCPQGWSSQIWLNLWRKPVQERLVIAGALIAAEIDRIS